MRRKPDFWSGIDQVLAAAAAMDPVSARAMIVELLDYYGGQAASIKADADVNPDRRAQLTQMLLIAGLLPRAQVRKEMK